MKKIMACALVFLMIFGTCATSYAFDLSNVKSFINEATTKVNAVVETVKSEGAEAAYNRVKSELISAGVDAGKIEAAEAAVNKAKDWYEANSDVIETVKNAYKPTVDAEIEKAKDWYEANKDKIDVDSLVESVKELSKKDATEVFEALEAIKDDVKLAAKKLGHKPYIADDSSKYVAIGNGTVNGVGLTNQKYNYTKLIAKELDIPVEAVSTIAGNEAVIKAADLITYQPDVADVALKVAGEPNWGKYFDEALMEEIWNQAKAVYEKDWNEQLPKIEAFVADVKAAVLAEVGAKFPVEYKDAVEDAIDEALAFCMPYVEFAINYAEENKGVVADFIANNETVISYAEKVAFAVVSYAIDTYKEIETIKTINPDAALFVVGMYNPFKGLEVEGVDAGEYFEYAIDATNVYYAALAAVKDYAFVDVSDAATDEIAEFNLDALNKLSANKEGHATIADKVMLALACECEYEKLDKNEHKATCVICGTTVTEKHVYGGDKDCDLCGYEKTTSGSSSSAGGAISVTYKVTFETNGGSKVNAVSVKKDALLEKPADPEKEGFVFIGWYTDEALTAKYDFAAPVTKSFTLYAKWASENVAKFKDVDPDAWFYDYVTTIIEKGFMNGISDIEFAPMADLTRGMFVTVLYRVEGTPVVEGENKFTDVADGQYYTDAVKWATANGIVTGVTETEFAPDASVTREQMAAMLARYVDYKKLAVADGEVAYTDDAEISEYAKDAVKVAANLKILIGNTDGTFAPKKNATRAEVATLFVRLLGVLEK